MSFLSVTLKNIHEIQLCHHLLKENITKFDLEKKMKQDLKS